MKPKTGFGVLVAMALSLALLLIPTSQAERSRQSSVVPNAQSTAGQPGNARAVNLARLPRTQTADGQGFQTEAAGLPNVLNSQSALSTAILMSTGGAAVQAEEVALLGNWDGREDYTADHAQKVDDFSFILTSPNQFVT